jgi:hypothetical protein
MEGLDEEEKEHAMENSLFCESLDALRDGWISRKNRGADEKLEDEEKFALMQWIDQHIRKEKRLKKYNILKIKAEKGHIKPWEVDDDDFT